MKVRFIYNDGEMVEKEIKGPLQSLAVGVRMSGAWWKLPSTKPLPLVHLQFEMYDAAGTAVYLECGGDKVPAQEKVA